MHVYLLHWKDGINERISGNSIADAFTKAGYGNGAMPALDYYEQLSILGEIKYSIGIKDKFFTIEYIITNSLAHRNPTHVRSTIDKMIRRKELILNDDFTLSINYDWKPNHGVKINIDTDQSAADDYLDYLHDQY